VVNPHEKVYVSPIQNPTEAQLPEEHGLKKQLNFVGHNKRVVEFGCATGYFSKMLQARGCRVTGLEISPHAAQEARQYCENVVVADLDFVSVKDVLSHYTYDVAVFGDVLEHLRNPWKVLEETRQLLRPHGTVVACIPNIAHGAIRLALLQGRFEYAPVGILDDTHLRFFTKASILEMFARCGYSVQAVDRVRIPVFSGSPLFPKVLRTDFPPQLVQFIETTDEADTLQFVIQASAMDQTTSPFITWDEAR
jgi:2-polyprenyl-3-methyl-5-hydroxy-6-metoxy-1,4-benzoquinol methylase